MISPFFILTIGFWVSSVSLAQIQNEVPKYAFGLPYFIAGTQKVEYNLPRVCNTNYCSRHRHYSTGWCVNYPGTLVIEDGKPKELCLTGSSTDEFFLKGCKGFKKERDCLQNLIPSFFSSNKISNSLLSDGSFINPSKHPQEDGKQGLMCWRVKENASTHLNKYNNGTYIDKFILVTLEPVQQKTYCVGSMKGGTCKAYSQLIDCEERLAKVPDMYEDSVKDYLMCSDEEQNNPRSWCYKVA
eukprot:Pgem_evm1s6319